MAPCGPPPKRWTLWPLERDAARAALRRTDLRGLVDALLSEYITHVREHYRRRPTLIAMLDKANLH
jgi:hypothetical protein